MSIVPNNKSIKDLSKKTYRFVNNDVSVRVRKDPDFAELQDRLHTVSWYRKNKDIHVINPKGHRYGIMTTLDNQNNETSKAS